VSFLFVTWEKKPSMLRRRVEHDYEQRCVYLVTMTVEGRRPLLGRLVGDAGAKEHPEFFTIIRDVGIPHEQTHHLAQTMPATEQNGRMDY
jgi:hypothetical protein